VIYYISTISTCIVRSDGSIILTTRESNRSSRPLSLQPNPHYTRSEHENKQPITSPSYQSIWSQVEPGKVDNLGEILDTQVIAIVDAELRKTAHILGIKLPKKLTSELLQRYTDFRPVDIVFTK